MTLGILQVVRFWVEKSKVKVMVRVYSVGSNSMSAF